MKRNEIIDLYNYISELLLTEGYKMSTECYQFNRGELAGLGLVLGKKYEKKYSLLMSDVEEMRREYIKKQSEEEDK